MLKKLIISTAALVAASGIAIAGNPVPYVGFGTGIINNSGLGLVKTTDSEESGPAYRAVPVNLFAGYGGQIDQNFYLAGEVSWTPGVISITDNEDNAGNLFKVSRTYGASILPGLMLSDNTVLFARLGIVNSRFKTLNHLTNDDSSMTGGQVGLGLQANVTPNFDVRGEYDYTAYGKRKVDGEDSIKPRTDQFMISAIYKFD